MENAECESLCYCKGRLGILLDKNCFSLMEFYYLPKKYHSVHKACFELVRQIEEFVVGKEYQFLQVSHAPMTEEEKDKFVECGDIWDFLKKYKEEEFYRLLKKQLTLGLLMDFCYFMQESLECSKK